MYIYEGKALVRFLGNHCWKIGEIIVTFSRELVKNNMS